jgi:hypothetical protein
MLHPGRGTGMDEAEAMRVDAGFASDGNGFVTGKK